MSRRKRFCLLALGSRGDVQPFVALALGLREHGHETIIAAAEDYRSLVRDCGLPFAPLVGRIADLMDRRVVAESLDGGPLGSLRLALRLRADAAPLFDALFMDTLAAARGSDVLVQSTLGQHIGSSVAEALGIPTVAAHFHPYAPSRHYANLFFPEWPPSLPRGIAPGLYRRLTHGFGIHGFRHLLQPLVNRARRRILKLPPLGPLALERFLRREGETDRHLYGYSPLLFPTPPDWDTDRHVVTGFWHQARPDTGAPPAELCAFLDRGPPPVYIGFGSVLAGRDPDGMTRLLVRALERVGMRGILHRGWGDLGNIPLPPTVFPVDSVPHDWLFPRCAAVVHHGGAGTTAAALRAQKPAVVTPVFGDQHLWARQLHRLGASPEPLVRRNLTIESLANSVEQALSNEGMRHRARTLGAAIAAEEGVTRAVAFLER